MSKKLEFGEEQVDMHFSDLADFPISQFDGPAKLIAVGWLEPGHDFKCCNIETGFVRKLAELLIDPWQPFATMGRHSCRFCRLSGGPHTFRLGDAVTNLEVQMGISNLWLPADGIVYVAPSLILHYIDSHGYSPPLEFQEAVIAAPPMRSMNYLKAIAKSGITSSRLVHPDHE